MQDPKKSGINTKASQNEVQDLIRACEQLAGQGKLAEAKALVADCIERYPNDPSLQSNFALLMLAQGDYSGAEILLQRILRHHRGHYHALQQLGIIYCAQGRFEESEEFLKRALDIRPSSCETLNALATVYIKKGRSEEAEILLMQATMAEPGKVEYALNYSRLAASMGRLKDAAMHLVRLAIASEVSDDTIMYISRYIRSCEESSLSLETLLEEAHTPSQSATSIARLRARYHLLNGSPDAALSDIYYLISYQEEREETLSLLMQCYYDLSEYTECGRVAARILRINPNSISAATTLGLTFSKRNKINCAIRFLKRALKRHPGHFGISTNLAGALMKTGNTDQSIEILKEALAQEPESLPCFCNLMFCYSIAPSSLYSEMLTAGQAFWGRYGGSVYQDMDQALIDRGKDNLIPLKVALEGCSRKSATEAQPHNTAEEKVHRELPAPDNKKLKIGFLSSDLGNHCVGRFLTSILKEYDRDSFHIELISPKRRFEEQESSITSMADDAFCVQGMTINEARSKIRQRNYDVLIDCNGYTESTGIELLAERCAPSQMHYIGYHASTAMPSMDYFISDGVIIDEHMDHLFSEKILRMNRTWLAMSSKESLPRAEAISTVDRPILGFFGQTTKITDECLEYWSAVCDQVPDALIVLKDRCLSDAYLTRRLIERLKGLGIRPEQIFILPLTASWIDHMKLYNAIDIALDSTPWSSATTAFDALGMGVPLMAIQGKTPSARMSSSVVNGAGKPEWICRSPEDYARLARTMCAEFRRYRAEKHVLQHEVLNGLLYDGKSLTSEFERLIISVASAKA